MSEHTKISRCDSTFNPWFGCSKVSPGCKNCYAERTWARLGLKPGERRRSSVSNWKQVERWNRRLTCDCGAVRIDVEDSRTSPCPKCGSLYRQPRVFCGSLCDWLDPDVPVVWLRDLLRLIHATPNLTWLLLTKRPENFEHRLQWVIEAESNQNAQKAWVSVWHGGFIHERLRQAAPENVWVGVTAENQEMWDKRVPELLRIPAAKRFVSVEPMLGPINMRLPFPEHDDDLSLYDNPKPDWVIFGGESGPNARPCNVEWIRDGVRQCRSAGVKPFVKQLGDNPYPLAYFGRAPTAKKGGDPSEWPEDLRVQEVLEC